jgi:hypothetical protein
MKFIIALSFLAIVSCEDKLVEEKSIHSEQQIAFQQTNFKQSIKRLIQSFEKRSHGHISISVNIRNSFIDVDSLLKLLNEIKDYDVTENKNFAVFEIKINNIKTVNWKHNNYKSTLTRIQKTTFDTTYKRKGLNGENSISNKITITDYEIFRIDNPKSIFLRIINESDFELLKIDSTTYRPLFEDRLLGLDEVQAVYDARKKASR